MGEESTNNINNQSQEAKVYPLAGCSFFLAIICVLAHCGAGGTEGIVFLFAAIIGFVVSAIFGVISIYKIKTSKGRFKGMSLAVIGLTISSIILATHVYAYPIARRMAHRFLCCENLSELGEALNLYAQDNNNLYPTHDKWCDLLIEGGYVDEGVFVCPANKKERCSYAMNPYCQPNSPNDVVLLFETKGGWNKFGGPELITLDNHKQHFVWFVKMACQVMSMVNL